MTGILALGSAIALGLVPLASANPPAVSITSGPSGLVTSTSAAFTFSVDDPDATVECELDGSGFSGCSSGVSYSGLADGDHTFAVRATSLGAETGTDSRSFIVDATGPSLSLPSVTENVDKVTSAPVSYSVGATDPHGPVSVTCTPASGSVFPLGTTTVGCTATDGLGNTATGSFGVTVQDVTPPVVTPPASIIVSVNGVTSAAVSFSATSSDGIPTCTPASGSAFPLGTTTVTCSATDGAGNTGSAGFDVTVRDTTAPSLTLPANQTVSINGAATATVTYSVSGLDGATALTPTCTPPSGSSFPLGTTTVSCTVTDAAGNDTTGTFTVTVQDTTAPTVSIGSGPSGTVGSDSATFAFSASDGTLTCALDAGGFQACSSPASYAGLTDGPHVFRVKATDGAGNATTVTRQWTIDTSPPTFTTPGLLTVEANGPAGSSVTYDVTAADDGVPLLPAAVSCTPASGSLFALGTTTVTCQAADALGNQGTATFSIVVRDTQPPTLTVADVTVAATTEAGIRRTDAAMAAFLRSLRATDLVSPSVIVTTDAPDLFPVGVTALGVTAVDSAGNAVSRSVRVTVLALGKEAPPPPDLDPPGDVRQLKAAAGDHVVTLTWTAPRASDLAAVEVQMSVANEPGQRVVFRGLGARAVIARLRNDVQHRFLIVAIDKAGNRSRGVVVQGTPRAALLALPRPGTRTARPPLLRWAPVRDASYFNVQLFRGKTKVLSAWPATARLQLTTKWVYDNVGRTLAPGTYSWFVWPGYGDRRAVKYGSMLGKSSFTIVARLGKPRPAVR